MMPTSTRKISVALREELLSDGLDKDAPVDAMDGPLSAHDAWAAAVATTTSLCSSGEDGATSLLARAARAEWVTLTTWVRATPTEARSVGRKTEGDEDVRSDNGGADPSDAGDEGSVRSSLGWGVGRSSVAVWLDIGVPCPSVEGASVARAVAPSLPPATCGRTA